MEIDEPLSGTGPDVPMWVFTNSRKKRKNQMNSHYFGYWLEANAV